MTQECSSRQPESTEHLSPREQPSTTSYNNYIDEKGQNNEPTIASLCNTLRMGQRISNQ